MALFNPLHYTKKYSSSKYKMQFLKQTSQENQRLSWNQNEKYTITGSIGYIKLLVLEAIHNYE